MKERLEVLRAKLGLQWNEFADFLGISVPMLSCLRRGERNVSPKVLARIEAAERGDVVLQPLHSTSDQDQSKPIAHTQRPSDALTSMIGTIARLTAIVDRLEAQLERVNGVNTKTMAINAELSAELQQLKKAHQKGNSR